jgi:hypothetical protein
MSEEQEPVIRVRDRRKFNPDGTPRVPDAAEEETSWSSPSAEQATPPPPVPAAREPERTEPERTAARPAAPAPDAASDLDDESEDPNRPDEPSLFSDFAVNLASQAAMYMGLVDDPLGPRVPVNLSAARQMLDILGMLREKTRGNLTPDENVLMERILSDLRMQYVSMATTRR